MYTVCGPISNTQVTRKKFSFVSLAKQKRLEYWRHMLHGSVPSEVRLLRKCLFCNYFLLSNGLFNLEVMASSYRFFLVPVSSKQRANADIPTPLWRRRCFREHPIRNSCLHDSSMLTLLTFCHWLLHHMEIGSPSQFSCLVRISQGPSRRLEDM